MTARSFVLAAILLAAACRHEDADFDRALARTRDAVAHAKTVTVYGIANEFDADYEQWRDRPRLAGIYPILRKATVPKERAAKLLAQLADRGTYASEAGVNCTFVPHDAVQIGSVIAVICRKCGDVELFVDGQSMDMRSLEVALARDAWLR